MHAYETLQGESLASVAQKFSVSTDALSRINGLAPEAPLSRGSRLLIPVKILRLEQDIPGGVEAACRYFQIPTEKMIVSDGAFTAVF